MNTTEFDTDTIAICVDCLQFLANGEIGDEDGGRTTEQVANDIDANWGGIEITLGRVRDWEGVEEIHAVEAIGCPYVASRIYFDLDIEDESPDNWEKCICDDDDEGWFSWHSCHACDSRLGGDRFHATVWRPVQHEETK